MEQVNLIEHIFGVRIQRLSHFSFCLASFSCYFWCRNVSLQQCWEKQHTKTPNDCTPERPMDESKCEIHDICNLFCVPCIFQQKLLPVYAC